MPRNVFNQWGDDLLAYHLIMWAGKEHVLCSLKRQIQSLSVKGIFLYFPSSTAEETAKDLAKVKAFLNPFASSDVK